MLSVFQFFLVRKNLLKSMTSVASTSSRSFADLNILYNKNNPKLTAECLKQAVALGFDTLAVNVELLDFDGAESSEHGNFGQAPKKKKTAKLTTVVPSPPKFKLDPLDLLPIEQEGKKFRLYTRLTLGLCDTSQVHCILKMPAVQEYDILAVWPKTEEMFNTIIKKLEVDLIATDITEKTAWISRKNLVQMAVEKGVAFEINYAPSLSDSSIRREVFVNGRDLLRATKGKGLVISSRAEKPIEIRSPCDVANMGVLFGMTPQQGGRAVSKHPKELLLHAQSKRTVKGVISVQNCPPVVDPLSALGKLLEVPEFRAEVEKVTKITENSHKRKVPDQQTDKKKKKKRIDANL